MITIWYSVVLGIVLCVSSAGTLAQEQDYEAFVKVLAAGDPDVEALAKHRLTVQNVRQMFAVDRELLELMKMVPALETRIAELHRRFDPQGRAGSAAVDVDAKVYEAIPEIAQILQRQKMSGREYWLTKMQAVVAAMWDEALTPEAPRSTRARAAEGASWRGPIDSLGHPPAARASDPASTPAARAQTARPTHAGCGRGERHRQVSAPPPPATR